MSHSPDDDDPFDFNEDGDMFADDEDEEEMLDPVEAKRRALELFLDAWETGLDEGIDAELLATTAIFAALTDMIDLYGEEAVAQMASTLPDRIRRGEFSLGEDMPTDS